MESVEKALSVMISMITAMVLAATLVGCQNAESPQAAPVSPNEREAAIQSVNEYLNTGRVKEALAITYALVQKDSLSSEAQETHALALLAESDRLEMLGKDGDKKKFEALGAYESACKLSVSPGLLFLSTAQIAHMLGENDTAKIYYKKAILAVPNDARASFFLGQIELLDSNWDEAKHWLEESLRLNPNEPPALLSLALAEAQLGHTSVAIPLASKGCQLNPNDIQLRIIQARVLRICGQVQQALERLLVLPEEAQNQGICANEISICLKLLEKGNSNNE